VALGLGRALPGFGHRSITGRADWRTSREPPLTRGPFGGTDSGRPRLLSPNDARVLWLLMDGYVYDIRDDQDHPPCGKAAGR